jgi:branched-chain amino acid transport system ATP-binding protein
MITLTATDLTVGYGTSTVLHQLALGVDSGEIVAILGPNGVGKTTLLRCLSGLLRPRYGQIEFLGKDITRLATRHRVKAGLILCPESRQLFPSFSVADNLRLGAMAAGRALDGQAIDDLMTVFPALRDRLAQVAGTLSGGQQQMVAVARALVARPRLLLLDEPSLGLAVGAISALADALKQASDQDGVTLLIAEQNPLLPQLIATRTLTLEGGKLVATKQSASLSGDLSWAFFDRALQERDQP